MTDLVNDIPAITGGDNKTTLPDTYMPAREAENPPLVGFKVNGSFFPMSSADDVVWELRPGVAPFVGEFTRQARRIGQAQRELALHIARHVADQFFQNVEHQRAFLRGKNITAVVEEVAEADHAVDVVPVTVLVHGVQRPDRVGQPAVDPEVNVGDDCDFGHGWYPTDSRATVGRYWRPTVLS